MKGSQADYARHRKAKGLYGQSRRAVKEAVDMKRISIKDGEIDFEKADAEWERNTDHRQRRGILSLPAGQRTLPQSPQEPGGDTLHDAQRRHEWLKVQKAEQELKRSRGELLERDQVKAEWAKLLTSFKNKMLYLPGKLAHKVAAVSDERTCRALIDREIKEALQVLSDYAV